MSDPGFNLHPIFQQIAESIAPRKETRFDRQLRLESLLKDFQPDAIEADALFKALKAGLQDRYGDAVLQDVLAEGMRFEEALEELDRSVTQMDRETWDEIHK